MDTQVTVLWTVPGISLQVHLLTFPLFLPVGLMDGAGLWPLYLLQAMEPTPLVLLSHHHAPRRKSCTSCLSSLQPMSFTF